MGQMHIVFTSVEQLEDLYINKNKYTTKYYQSAINFHHIMKQSILFAQSDDPAYE